MCGIAGFIRARPDQDLAALERQVQAMVGTLSHRGPDASGVHTDPAHGLALGHARLSIIDLSDAGAQPMTSADGRCVLTYNGEIYNFSDLRARLEGEGVAFRGASDTEVLVEGIARWGIDRMLDLCAGMFAFAVWMRDEGRLYLARDRVGKKPLYYGWAGRDFVFGSELKALRAYDGFDGAVDPQALAAYFRFAYVPGDQAIYRDVNKLPPGCVASVDMAGRAAPVRRYWSAAEEMAAGAEGARAHPLSMTEAEERLDTVLREAVARRMVADVPVGAFLSGGIDSSLVVAQMQALYGSRTRAFTVSFDTRGDEAPHAAAVAAHLGVDHTIYPVGGAEALAIVPEMGRIYDEPFADVSQVPSALLCALVRRDVGVALSGDGGDEMYCGYDRYAAAIKRWRSLSRVPGPLRRAGASALRLGPGGEDVARLRAELRARDPLALYRVRTLRNHTAGALVPGAGHGDPFADSPAFDGDREALMTAMALHDMGQWLPDDILVKMDRASMAAGLEVRNPLLDIEMIRLAARLPLAYKAEGGDTKILLKSVLARHVPRALFERPKQGFAPPLREWLNGPLRDWAEDLLSPEALGRDGLIDPTVARRYWQEYKGGKSRRRMIVWSLLMFQNWRAVNAS